MTETTGATATATDSDAAAEAARAAKVAAVQARLDDFGRMAVDRLVSQTTERNALVTTLLSVGGDRITRLDAMRADLAEGKGDADTLAVHKQIVTLQEKLGELTEQRDKRLNAIIDAEIAKSDVDPKVLEEQIKTADASIKTGLNYAVGLYGDDVKLLLPDMVQRRGSRSGGGNSGGSGKRRLRGFDVYVDDVIATTPDKDGKQRSSFSAAAKVVGLKTVEPLSDAYRSLNGDDPDNWPTESVFEYTNEGKAYKVRAVRTAGE